MILQALQGVINAFDTPARQAFVVEMVDDPADLANAIAPTRRSAAASSAPAAARSSRPLARAGASSRMPPRSRRDRVTRRDARAAVHRPATDPVLRSLADGFRYVRGFIPVRSGLLLVALISVLGMPFQVLMPVMASDVLGGGAHTLGMLMTTTGLGALLGTLYLASRQTVVGLGRKIAQASVGQLIDALVVFSCRTTCGSRCSCCRSSAPAS
jgi:hypothetical protein